MIDATIDAFTKEEKEAAMDILEQHKKEGTPLTELLQSFLSNVMLGDQKPLAVEPDEILDTEGKTVEVKKAKGMGLLYMIFGAILNLFGLMPRMCDRAQQGQLDSIGVKATFVTLPFAAGAGYLLYYLVGAWITVKWIMLVVTVIASILTGVILFYIIRGLYEYISTGGQGVGNRA